MRSRELSTPGQSWKPIPEELVKDALEYVLEKKHLPCLLMDQYVTLSSASLLNLTD